MVNIQNLELEILKRKKREQNSRKGVFVDLTYIDMAGDLNAGILLSQLVYWNSFDSNGNEKLRVMSKGKLYLAKSKKEWYDEVRLSKKQIARAEKILLDKEIIEIELKKFGGNPTNHYWLNWAKFLELEELILLGENDSDQREQTSINASSTDNINIQKNPNDSQTVKTSVSDQREQRKVRKVTNDSDQREQSLTETTTENLEDDEETFLPAIDLFIKAKGKITQLQKEDIKQLVNTYSIDFVVKAIRVTSNKANNFNMDYIEKVLISYKDNGFQTIKDIEDAENIDKLKKETINNNRKKNINKQLETPTRKTKNEQKGNFNSFEQRTYDFDDLEKKLLGWEN